MKVEAKTSFAGSVTMGKGEIKELSDKAVLDDLLQAGYIKEVKPVKKAVKASESKRNNSK